MITFSPLAGRLVDGVGSMQGSPLSESLKASGLSVSRKTS